MKALGKLVLLLGLAPALIAAQEVTVASPAPLRLRVTTASEEAARHFWAGVADTRNIFSSRATMHFDQAVALDRSLGLARVFRGAVAPGLTAEQRRAEIDAGIATMSSATTGELLTALGFREWFSGNRRQAQALFKTASELLPGDPNLAFYAAQGPDGPAVNAAALRAVTERFPEDGPTYNVLAYALWQTGDRAGALTAVRRYVELEPDHPNSHDSYAELLQWDGRFTEALSHYQRAAQLDSSYSEAYNGAAEVLQLTGRGGDARRQLALAIARAPSKPAEITGTRALAHSLLLDGMVKEGMDQLAIAARSAQAADRKGLAAQIHLDMAIADAQLGRGRAIASHLRAAAEIGGDPNTPVQLAGTAVAHAIGGDVEVARQAARTLAEKSSGEDQWNSIARAATAIILLRENKPREAMTELAAARSDDPLVRALLAECYRATGNVSDARTVRSQVLEDPQINLGDGYATVARIRAAKLKVS